MARPRGSKKQRAFAMRKLNGAEGKLLGYCRVSTTEQGEHGHSLDGQRTRLQATADREGFVLVDVVTEVASGRKDRDGLKEAQERIIAGEAQGLLVPKVDRLGRSTIALLKFVAWAEENHVDILSVDEGWVVRTDPATGQVRVDGMFTGRAWFAELEARKISERTKEGLAAAKAKGVKLGRPAENVGEVAQRATELRRQGLPWATIADTLNAEGFTTARGGKFYPATVGRMIERTDPTANPVGGYRR